MDQHARFDHLIDAGALGRQIFAQGETLVGGVSQAKLALDLRAQPAVGEIAARPRADRRLQLLLEKSGGELQHVLQRRAGFFAARGLRRHLGQGQARVSRQPLDRVGEGKSLRSHDEVENIAVLPG